jgi:hypothetical protein
MVLLERLWCYIERQEDQEPIPPHLTWCKRVTVMVLESNGYGVKERESNGYNIERQGDQEPHHTL